MILESAIYTVTGFMVLVPRRGGIVRKYQRSYDIERVVHSLVIIKSYFCRVSAGPFPPMCPRRYKI